MKSSAVTHTSNLTGSLSLTLEKESEKSNVLAPVSSLSKETTPSRGLIENEKHVSSTMVRLSLPLERGGEEICE